MDINTIVAQMGAMETMLSGLYDDMVPMVKDFTNLARAVGGLGALIYIGSRIWGHQARAEPIDVFPLLRPFLIGLCILLFPQVCGTLRGLSLAISHSTDQIRTTQSQKIDQLQAEKKRLLDARPENKYFVSDAAYEQRIKDLSGPTGFGGIGDRMSLTFDKMSYDVNQSFRAWMKNTLELFHVAARLLISVLATFLLIVLSVLGPLTFAIAIFPGFGGGIQKWLGNFITISLWVPVCNIFGSIMATFQVQMLQSDVDRIKTGAGLDSADFGYLVFLCIAISGYLLVPKVTDMLIAASGAGGMAQAFVQTGTGMAAGIGAASGAAGREMGGISSTVAQNGAAGMGRAVGAGQGFFGAANFGNANANERLGHRAGSAMREKLNKRFRGPASES
jgi:conjugative transposon TraJ protein